MRDKDLWELERNEWDRENRVLKSTLSAIRLYCSNHAFGGWRHDIAGMIDKVH